MEFSDRQFRDALGLFPTGVVIVTADVDGVRLANTVSSFNAVSLSPPLVLFSMARTANSFGLWQRASHFAVMILEEEQNDLSSRFARAGSDKWEGIPASRGINGAPLLPKWHACFECSAHARYDGGDHEIFVGHVDKFTIDAPTSSGPLVFYRGRYRTLSRETIGTPAEADVWLHGW